MTLLRIQLICQLIITQAAIPASSLEWSTLPLSAIPPDDEADTRSGVEGRAGVVPASCGCLTVQNGDKVGCGAPGIKRDACLSLGCCWKRIFRVPWCFHPVGVGIVPEPETCEPGLSDPSQRQSCGWTGITGVGCGCLGCCFDDSIWGELWCFLGDTGSDNVNNAWPSTNAVMRLGVTGAELWQKTISPTGVPGLRGPVTHRGVVITTSDNRRWLVHKGNEYLHRCESIIILEDYMDSGWAPVAGNSHSVSRATAQNYMDAGSTSYDMLSGDCGNAVGGMMALL